MRAAMKLLLRIARMLFMLSVGVFLLTVPFRLPGPVEWSRAAPLIGVGAITLYVEAYLVWRQLRGAPKIGPVR